jgi:hypothetical protein
MDTIVVPKAVEIAARLRNAQRLRVFEEAAADFVRLIGMVPDCAPHALSVAEVTTLRHLAEGVIEQIEARLSARADPAGRQQALAGTVYEIGRLMEEITIWSRHYRMGRAS